MSRTLVNLIKKYWLEKYEHYMKTFEELYYHILFKIKAEEGLIADNKYKRSYYQRYLTE